MDANGLAPNEMEVASHPSQGLAWSSLSSAHALGDSAQPWAALCVSSRWGSERPQPGAQPRVLAAELPGCWPTTTLNALRIVRDLAILGLGRSFQRPPSISQGPGAILHYPGLLGGLGHVLALALCQAPCVFVDPGGGSLSLCLQQGTQALLNLMLLPQPPGW